MSEGYSVSEQVQLLRDAKQAIAQLEDWSKEKKRFEDEEKKLQKKLESEEKSLESTISSTTKKKRDGVASTFDKDIDEAQSKMKKVKADRGKAKDSGIKDRIERETYENVADNKRLKDMMKGVYKAEGAPALARTKAFFTFYDPDTLTEWISIIAVFIAFVGLIPTALVYVLTSTETISSVVVIVLIYVAFLAVFILVYVLGYLLLKKPNRLAVEQASDIRKRMRINDKQIRKITKKIKKDKDEGKYDLDSYDYDIAKLESQVDEINKKKEEALATFDDVTSKVIRDEATEESRPKIEAIKKEIKENKVRLDDMTEKYNAHDRFVKENYESVLTKDYMSADKIDKLLNIINDGNATSIADAITFLKSGN